MFNLKLGETTMKKILLIAAMIMMSIGTFAQSGKFAGGTHIGYAGYGDGYNPFGIGFQWRYYFTDQARADLSYTYWFPKDNAGIYNWNLNFNYLIPVQEKFSLYPIAGAALDISHASGTDSESIFGFNLGAGAEYSITEKVCVNFEFMYQSAKKTKTVTVMGVSQDYDIKADGPIFRVGLTTVL